MNSFNASITKFTFSSLSDWWQGIASPLSAIFLEIGISELLIWSNCLTTGWSVKSPAKNGLVSMLLLRRNVLRDFLLFWSFPFKIRGNPNQLDFAFTFGFWNKNKSSLFWKNFKYSLATMVLLEMKESNNVYMKKLEDLDISLWEVIDFLMTDQSKKHLVE